MKWGTSSEEAILLLHLTKNIWSTGKVIILDSGFCVLRGIIELYKKGVFASAMIKKRRYWPKDVPGGEIIRTFENFPIGYRARRPGTTSDNVNFDIFAMKERDYVCMFMSTYGALNVNPDQKLSYRAAEQPGQPPITFHYTEVQGNHFWYRGAVDNHNAKRHDGHSGAGMSFEESWATTRWIIEYLRTFWRRLKSMLTFVGNTSVQQITNPITGKHR